MEAPKDKENKGAIKRNNIHYSEYADNNNLSKRKKISNESHRVPLTDLNKVNYYKCMIPTYTNFSEKKLVETFKPATKLNLPVKATQTDKIIVDTRYITFRNKCDRETPNSEVFIDGSQHYITYTSQSSQICRKQHKISQVSPITSNVYTTSETLISQGIPDVIKQPNKKLSLTKNTNLEESLKEDANAGSLLNDQVDYMEDILKYLHEKDDFRVLSEGFLKKYNVNDNHRTVIINWLVQVTTYLHLPSCSLFTSVRIFDFILASIKVSKNMYQLIILVTLWIMNKFEGYNTNLTVPKLLQVCNRAFSRNQFLNMEKKLLTFLEYNLLIPDVTIYINIYLKKFYTDQNTQMLIYSTYYILECFSMNSKFSTLQYSLQATSALCLSLAIINKDTLTRMKIEEYRYKKEDVRNIMDEMLQQVHRVQDPKCEHRQPYIKYSGADKMEVSIVLLKNLVAT